MEVEVSRGWWRGIAGRVSMVSVLLVAALALRVVVAGQGELRRGLAAEARGEVDRAVMHYREAAAAYVPASPFHQRAFDRLLELARQAQADGRLHEALVRARVARAALSSSRSLLGLRSSERARVDHLIAGLMAQGRPAPLHAHESPLARRERYFTQLEGAADGTLWPAVALLASLLYVGASLRATPDGPTSVFDRGSLAWAVLGLLSAALACALS